MGIARGDVTRVVLGGSMTLVACGVALGVGTALGLARLVESLLFGVHGTDPVTLIVAAATLLGVGAAAAYWPARLDPIASLRYD
jgi:putative ABC transport system permease protein